MKKKEFPIVGQPIYRIHNLKIYTDCVVKEDVRQRYIWDRPYAGFLNPNNAPTTPNYKTIQEKYWTVLTKDQRTYDIFEPDKQDFFLNYFEAETIVQKQLKALIQRRKKRILTLTEEMRKYEALLV